MKPRPAKLCRVRYKVLQVATEANSATSLRPRRLSPTGSLGGRDGNHRHAVDSERDPEAAVERAVRVVEVGPEAARRGVRGQRGGRTWLGHVEETRPVVALDGEEIAEADEVLCR